MENYICINGKKAELTEEQMKALGIELPKANPFKRAEKDAKYFSIAQDGTVDWHYEVDDSFDNDCFNVANYCTDKAILEQRALHETLNRLLWRFKMENDAESETHKKPYIGLRYDFSDIVVSHCDAHFGEITFNSEEMAYRALHEVVHPFLAAHPEFKL